MDYILIIVVFVVVAGSLFVGFRLGRNVSVGRPSRSCNDSASTGAATTEEINRAVDRAIRANAETAEIVQKMRDILSRHSSGSGSSTTSGEAE